VPFGAKPAIVIREASGELKALSATCTHLSCTVQYRGDMSQIWCACHNGRYDLTGKNVAGPPPRPLEAFDVSVRNDEIMISRRA
jgi:Rieske Fe-S protein